MIRSMNVLLLTVLASAIVFAADEPPPRKLDYPQDLRGFRKKALAADGLFAPDIAFTVRICPNCQSKYVFGTFPRLSRKPFDSIEDVAKAVEAAAQKPPPKTMFSRRLGQPVPRACPNCKFIEPKGARPDKALFYHIFPETGADMEIEYDVHGDKVASPIFYRIEKDKEAEQVLIGLGVNGSGRIPESEIKKTFGAYFSLRAVWNEIFEAKADAKEVVYEEVSPGMRFILRPKGVTLPEFKKFADKKLKTDRAAGEFSFLDTPLKIEEDAPDPEGIYVQWAPKYQADLKNALMECFVAISFPHLRKAVNDVLASRHLSGDFQQRAEREPGFLLMSKGELKVGVDLAPFAQKAVRTGLSLHQAYALFLTEPVFTLENAARIEAALEKAYPGCEYVIDDGRFMTIKDKNKQARKVDLMTLASEFDPDDKYLFELFCGVVLPWDRQNHSFGPEPKPQDVSPVGLPAFVERRVRPHGFLASKQETGAFFEPKEDADKHFYDLCYTSECTRTLVYIDPAKPRFKDLTLEEVRKLYERDGAILPAYYDTEETFKVMGDYTQHVSKTDVRLVLGRDIASLGAEAGRCVALAAALDYPMDDGLHLYAIGTNAVILSSRKLLPDELTLATSRIKNFAVENFYEIGLELSLHFDQRRAEVKGRVMRKPR